MPQVEVVNPFTMGSKKYQIGDTFTLDDDEYARRLEFNGMVKIAKGLSRPMKNKMIESPPVKKSIKKKKNTRRRTGGKKK